PILWTFAGDHGSVAGEVIPDFREARQIAVSQRVFQCMEQSEPGTARAPVEQSQFWPHSDGWGSADSAVRVALPVLRRGLSDENEERIPDRVGDRWKCRTDRKRRTRRSR